MNDAKLETAIKKLQEIKVSTPIECLHYSYLIFAPEFLDQLGKYKPGKYNKDVNKILLGTPEEIRLLYLRQEWTDWLINAIATFSFRGWISGRNLLILNLEKVLYIALESNHSIGIDVWLLNQGLIQEEWFKDLAKCSNLNAEIVQQRVLDNTVITDFETVSKNFGTNFLKI